MATHANIDLRTRRHQDDRPRPRKRTSIWLENLEDRRLLAAALVYVNGAWTGMPDGTKVTVGSNEFTIGTDAFALVQGGVDHATTGGVVNVLAGTYNEAVTIDHPLTLDGDSQATTTISKGMWITAAPAGTDRVTVSDLAVLATDSPMLNSTDYGIRIDATAGDTAPITLERVTARSPITFPTPSGYQVYGAGILVTPNNHTIDDVVMDAVTADNSYTHGMYVLDTGAYTSGTLSHLTITNSSFDANNAKATANPPGGQSGYGFYTQAPTATPSLMVDQVSITNTTFNDNRLKGIYAESLSNATFDGVTVQGNGNSVAVTAYKPAGFQLNLKYADYTNITIKNSKVSDNGNGNATTGQGLSIAARNDGAYSSRPASLTGLTLTNVAIDGSATDLYLANNLALGSVVMAGVTLGGSPGVTGLYLDGVTAGQTLDLGDTQFAGELAGYVASNSSVVCLADGAMFAGVVGKDMTNDQAYAASAKILDALDVGGAGTVYLRPHELFVNPGAGNLPRGITAAVAGDRVHVNAGTYAENLSLTKAIAIEGELGTIVAVSAGDAIDVLLMAGQAELSRLQIQPAGTPIAGYGIDATVDGTLVLDGVSVEGFTTGSVGFQSPGTTGTLAIDGAETMDIPIAVQSGTLSGVGTLTGGVSVAASAVVAPGPLPGVLQVDKATFASGATLRISVSGPLIGIGYTQLYVTQSVDLTGVTLDLVVDPAYTPAEGAQFLLVQGSVAGAITGNFSGLPEGSHVSINGTDSILSYVGGPGGFNVTLSVPGAPPPYIDPGGPIVAIETQVVGDSVQIVRNGQVVESYPLSSVSSLTIDTSASENSVLVFDMNQSGLMGLTGGVNFIANPAGDNTVIITGTGTSTGTYRPDPSTYGDGLLVLTAGSQTVNVTFTGLKPTIVHDMSQFVFQTTGSRGDDDIHVDSELIGGGINAYRISGTSGGVAFESVTFYNIPDVTIDTGANDAGALNPADSVTIGPMGGPVAQGLTNLNVDTGSGADQLTVDFSVDNPIPTGNGTGLYFQGTTGSATLNLVGGSFATETHYAWGPGTGTIWLADAGGQSTGIGYGGLAPINDTTTVASYVLNLDSPPDRSFSVTGSTYGLLATALISAWPSTPSPTPAFESMNIANKASVTINTSSSSPGYNALVDLAVRPEGLNSLLLNLGASSQTEVSLVRVPSGVATSLTGGPQVDVTDVTGAGIPTGSTVLLDGGANSNILNYDAGGLMPTVQAGDAGHVLISVPGAGTIDAAHYARINITNTPPLAIVPGTARTLSGIVGSPLTDAIVGTFTATLPSFLSTLGLPASVFTASIDWGDPSPDLAAGTVTQDASDPSTYYIKGSHTFATAGAFTVGNAIAFAGGTASTTQFGIPIFVSFDAAAAIPGTSATATISQAVLSTTVFPISGTEGKAIASAPVALFVDAGGPQSAENYAASIVIRDPGGTVVATLDGAISQVGTSAAYIVTAPAFTLPEDGVYTVTVTVTATDGRSSVARTVATIGDAALNASPLQPVLSGTEARVFPVPIFGTPSISGPVAAFVDDNPFGQASDFVASIDWGDGTAPTMGTITQPVAGTSSFLVSGSHTYADAGVNGGDGHFIVRVQITDRAGATLVVLNNATIADVAVPLAGRLNPASDSGVSNSDAITNVRQPDFLGSSEPFSNVSVIATTPGGATLSLGSVRAAGDGSWNLLSGVALADGHYRITATAVDQFGETTTTTPTVVTPDLLIDTQGPVISAASYYRSRNRVDYTILDPGQGSGVYTPSLFDSANYNFAKLHASRNYLGKWIVTGVTATADPSIANAQDVSVTFNGGRNPGKGYYAFTVRDASAGASGVQDIAGNHLDGRFYGTFPTGNGTSGDFVARFAALGCRPTPAQTAVGTVTATQAGTNGKAAASRARIAVARNVVHPLAVVGTARRSNLVKVVKGAAHPAGPHFR